MIESLALEQKVEADRSVKTHGAAEGQVTATPSSAHSGRVGGNPRGKTLLTFDSKGASTLDQVFVAPLNAPEYTKLTAVEYPIATRLRAVRALGEAGDASSLDALMHATERR